jgi:UDP-N-acetylmuramoylalanine--D-glutamate ligase
MKKENPKLKKYQNKKIAILGLGIENQALLRYFIHHKVKANFIIHDSRSQEQLGALFLDFDKYKNIDWVLGAKFNQNLFIYDFLFRAPGWPVFCPGITEALKNGHTILTSPMNLFFEICPTKNIIGVTGTKGKGTTASLIYKILKTAKKSVYLGGNIGIAPINFLDKLKATDFVVLELSSFQLEDLQFSPKIAVITNIFKEHLSPADPNNPNYHKSYASYIKAKLKISHAQKSSDFLVLNNRDKKTFLQHAGLLGSSQKNYFTNSELPSRLVGNYNKENIAAATTVAKILKIKPEIIARAVRNFSGLEHRLEYVATIYDVDYFDNSFATTPESTAMDLDSFVEPIILLAGGADKGSSFRALAKKIKAKVKFLIFFPGAGTDRLLIELKEINFPKNQMFLARNMELAVIKANELALPGEVVLLSTGCASFGLFKNYKERGNLFKTFVNKLTS